MTKLQGKYRAKRDDQTYTYEVSWRPAGHFAAWDAKVRLDNQLIGLPSGQVEVSRVDPLDETIRHEVEQAIEHRLHADF